jgi:hypothetical protein
VRLDVPVTLGRALVTRKALVGRSLWFSGPSVVRFVAADFKSNRSRAQSRCVPLPRVASGRLGLFQIGCDPTNRSGAGASCCGPEGDELEACSTGSLTAWRVATNRHGETNRDYGITPFMSTVLQRVPCISVATR